MNISEVQTVFERATPEEGRNNFTFAILIGTIILIGTLVVIDQRKKAKIRNETI